MPRSNNEDEHRFYIAAAVTNVLLVGVVGLGAAWTTHGGGIGPYLMMLGLFHLLEFWGTALLRPEQLSWGSFAFNGVPYAVAITLGVVEFATHPISLAGLSWAPRLQTAGLVVACAALCLRTVAVTTAKSSFNHVVQSELPPGHRLITNGPYRALRHPSYTAYYWFALAGQLILLNPITLCTHAIVLGLFFRRRIAIEERALLRRFGSRYAQFRKRRLLLIPGAGHCSTRTL